MVPVMGGVGHFRFGDVGAVAPEVGLTSAETWGLPTAAHCRPCRKHLVNVLQGLKYTAMIELMFVTEEAQERAEELDAAAALLRRCTDALDVGGLTATDAADLLGTAAEVERLAAGARVLLSAKAAEAGTWRAKGHRSPEDWLAQQAGTSVGQAKGDLETSKKLSRCPKTEQAVRKGKVSPEQAREITDAAAADPSSEGDLLGLAEKGAAHKELRDESRRRKAAADPDPEATARRIQRERRIGTGTDSDGTWWLHARGPAAAGAGVMAALRRQADRIFHANRRAGTRENPDAYLFDALVQLLTGTTVTGAGAPTPATPSTPPPAAPANRAGHQPQGGAPASEASGTPAPGSGPPGSARPAGTGPPAGPAETGAGPPGTGPPAGTGPPDGTSASDAEPTLPGLDVSSPPAPRAVLPSGADAKIIVLIDHSALVRGYPVSGETCEIPGVGTIDVATVQAWMTDAFVAAVLTEGTDITKVVHLGRRATALQTTALQAAGIRCARLGCGRTEGLQLDHRIEWSTTRHTKIDELDWLCRFDHSLKTLYGWRLEPGTGPRRMLPPEPAEPSPTPPAHHTA
jgi:hypothetical protein